ncbi:MAG TPA: hypothetical protein EYH05_20315 [Anaerolineae bacterium]|nr:hypothetical protein [Anaerolineae bacterium]
MADSWEYLSISEDIYQKLDFYNKSLGEWRLPGYPVFLAIVHIVINTGPNSIVLAQKLVGLGSVVLGLIIGYLARSRLTAIGLVLFLSINPVYLLNEHLVMTEALFLFSLLVFSVIALLCLRDGINFTTGFLLGLSAIITILVRANGLFFTLSVIASVFWLQAYTPFQLAVGVKKFFIKPTAVKFFIGLCIGIILIFGPWLWRNYKAYNKFLPLTYNTNLNLLAYSAEHFLIDISLPQMSQYTDFYNPEYPGTIYSLLSILRKDIKVGEREGSFLLKEQIFDHPGEYLQETGYAFYYFVGYPVPGVASGRSDTLWWFNNMVTEVTRIHEINQNFYVNTNTPTAYITSRTDNNLIQSWAKAGASYLLSFRATLTTIFLMLLIIYLFYMYRQCTQPALRHHIIIIFSLAYFVTILAHSITLSDYDRFAVPFDWIPLLVICLIIEEFILRHKENQTASF